MWCRCSSGTTSAAQAAAGSSSTSSEVRERESSRSVSSQRIARMDSSERSRRQTIHSSVCSISRAPARGGGGVVGEDADDVRTAADLAVDALEQVPGPQLGPVFGRERHERQQVFLGLLEQLADLRRDRLQAGEDVGQAAAGLVTVDGGKTSLSAADTRPRWAGWQWPCMVCSDEVHVAAPRCVQDPRDRLQALVMLSACPRKGGAFPAGRALSSIAAAEIIRA